MSEASDKRRGSRKPVKGTRKGQALTEAEKAAIVVMRGQRVPSHVIAEKFGISEATVYVVMRAMRKPADALVGYEAREDLTDRAMTATLAGLDYDEDPYKRGALGVSVLKGVGVLQPDGVAVQVNNLINSVPPGFQEAFRVVLEDEKEKV